MAPELNPKSVADWHWREYQKHQELAEFHKRTAQTIEAGGVVVDRRQSSPRGELPTLPPSVAVPRITLAQMEAELRRKAGRVAHVAKRLKTYPTMINELLNDPDCNYAIGERGFIYRKDDPKYLAMLQKRN